MGQARDCINALTSDVLVAVGMNPGTASEVALAIRAKKTIILLGNHKESAIFFKKLGGNVQIAETVSETISLIKKAL